VTEDLHLEKRVYPVVDNDLADDFIKELESEGWRITEEYHTGYVTIIAERNRCIYCGVPVEEDFDICGSCYITERRPNR
jgi:hypothetical protein